MVRHDLEAAGIPIVDDNGDKVDFHSLRTSFVSSLARAGVPMAVTQKLARHSDPRLTANVYTHLGIIDLAGAMELLPKLQAAPEAPEDGSATKEGARPNPDPKPAPRKA